MDPDLSLEGGHADAVEGITDYIMHYKIGIMFGCGSLPGTNPADHAVPLSYLYHRHPAPPGVPAARRRRALCLDEHAAHQTIDEKRTLVGLPPLIKGYLRLGGAMSGMARWSTSNSAPTFHHRRYRSGHRQSTSSTTRARRARPWPCRQPTPGLRLIASRPCP